MSTPGTDLANNFTGYCLKRTDFESSLSIPRYADRIDDIELEGREGSGSSYSDFLYSCAGYCLCIALCYLL